MKSDPQRNAWDVTWSLMLTVAVAASVPALLVGPESWTPWVFLVGGVFVVAFLLVTLKRSHRARRTATVEEGQDLPRRRRGPNRRPKKFWLVRFFDDFGSEILVAILGLVAIAFGIVLWGL
jgi:hypothetical protein